jgi:hypothetical protein
MKSTIHCLRRRIWKGLSLDQFAQIFWHLYLEHLLRATPKFASSAKISCSSESANISRTSRHRFILGGQIWSRSHRQPAQNLLDYFVIVKVKLSIDPSRSRTCVLTRLKTQMLTLQDSWLCLHHGFLNSRLHVPVLLLYVWQRGSRSYLYLWHNGIKLDTLLREPTPVYLEVLLIEIDCVQSHNSTVWPCRCYSDSFQKRGGGNLLNLFFFMLRRGFNTPMDSSSWFVCCASYLFHIHRGEPNPDLKRFPHSRGLEFDGVRKTDYSALYAILIVDLIIGNKRLFNFICNNRNDSSTPPVSVIIGVN